MTNSSHSSCSSSHTRSSYMHLWYEYNSRRNACWGKGEDRKYIGCDWCKELCRITKKIRELKKEPDEVYKGVWLPIYQEALERAESIVAECDVKNPLRRKIHFATKVNRLYKLAWSAGAWASDAFNEANQEAWEYWSVRKSRLLRLARKAAARAERLKEYDWIKEEAERLCLPL